MSFSLARTVAKGASTLFGTSRSIISSQVIARNIVCKGRGLQTQRSFTRSFWYMCQSSSPQLQKDACEKATGWTRTCGCCGLHTQGDKDLTEFLDQEIKEERKLGKKPEKVKGFEVSTDGAEVTFTKKSDNECVTVTMNVNNSVDDESGADVDQDPDQAQDVKMVCRPPFLIEINKGGKFTLGIQCAFPSAEGYNAPQGEDEQYGADLIEIQEVAIYSGDNWGDKTYGVEGPVMDGNLYDMLLNMLEERGVDAEFVEQIIEHCTAYEHQQYVGFLQGLQEFSAAK